jgi:hypothetical protein
MDDEMAQEMRDAQGAPSDGPLEESLDTEPLGDDQPIGVDTPLSESDPDDHDARSRFAGFLRRSIFPADARVLFAEARSNNAPDDVLDAVKELPAKTTYQNSSEVWAAITGGAAPS